MVVSLWRRYLLVRGSSGWRHGNGKPHLEGTTTEERKKYVLGFHPHSVTQHGGRPIASHSSADAPGKISVESADVSAVFDLKGHAEILHTFQVKSRSFCRWSFRWRILTGTPVVNFPEFATGDDKHSSRSAPVSSIGEADHRVCPPSKGVQVGTHCWGTPNDAKATGGLRQESGRPIILCSGSAFGIVKFGPF